MAWKNPWYDSSKPHHTAEGFRNPEPDSRQQGDLQRWRRERKAQGLPHPPRQGYDQFITQWWQPADLNGEDDRLWWLGHAALLMRINQHYILIDPALSRRASPLPFIGPERKTPSPLAIDQLPRLDYVLISHNHYDHLDKPTIKQIVRRFPDTIFLVPLGLAEWCKRHGVKQVHELDWWQQKVFAGIQFDAVPARHWSMRTVTNRNRTLWCGWVIRTASLRFWFSGDSGYSDSLLAIAQHYGPFNLAALPIGAYAPRWFMGAQHMDPQQAVALWRAIGQPLTLPIQWGVFELADESLDAPPAELQRALAQSGEVQQNFAPWKIGASHSLSDLNPT
ncbi:MBL fold metallo-hydrolase [Pantoea stewartii]|uniref:MBL fold metallo-hydrolase n=1 Tax=Pantoea stewartii subsp. stewartii DC283 TaxID=660596 RepID=H3RDH2_PANSE|nr:MBL fold metallo-hydrolase [Pantoea stewartii]ARF50519.1 MBL fold metallo-hydrolase [Pantoea stewartii subsp. stewartii DC283]EHU00628.1 hypothetical protein CKS_2675 [Pantoea stewartii subsp. stewartii DC283]KAB0551936.1 MBL fold metallo-hydrolase [Pantoea stewartii subsp. stewartii]